LFEGIVQFATPEPLKARVIAPLKLAPPLTVQLEKVRLRVPETQFENAAEEQVDEREKPPLMLPPPSSIADMDSPTCCAISLEASSERSPSSPLLAQPTSANPSCKITTKIKDRLI
jgi:hypothetical protein